VCVCELRIKCPLLVEFMPRAQLAGYEKPCRSISFESAEGNTEY